MNGKPWTPQALVKLRVLYPHHPTWAVAEVMGRSLSSVRSKAKRLHIVTLGRETWNAEDVALLRALYADHATEEIARRLGRGVHKVYATASKLGLRKSAAYLRTVPRPGLEQGAAFRFGPGHVPANKGLRRPGFAPGRMAETQFKRGERRGAAAENWVPVGTILKANGYLRIKLREARRGEATGNGNSKAWPMLHREVWKKHRGRIPRGHIVVFRDGNADHCEIGNLECISRRELMRRNSVHNLPQELKQVIQLNGALKRRLGRAYEKQNDGPTQSSVRYAGSAQR